ncbi:MAG: glycosyltransferase family 39 protein, partial [Ardenticatenales bacterium]
RGLMLVLALSLALNTVGAGWGLPNEHSWSNDDQTPKIPLRIGQIWCCSTDKYPYLQPLITHAIYAPSLWWWRARGELAADCAKLSDAKCYSRSFEQFGWLMRLSRLLAALMGVGTVAAVYVLALRLYADRRAATAAALAAAVIHEVVLFSHFGNVDVPYLFWFAWSMVAFVDIVDKGRLRDYAAFGLLAAASLASKESIVGAYVLVGAAILVVHARRALAARPPGASAWPALGRSVIDRRLWALAAGLFGLYGIANNVLFNRQGFIDHVNHWIGGTGIDPWNEGYTGPLALVATFLARLRDGVGWPWLALAAIAVVWAAWRDRRTLWAVLPAVSYYHFTIAPIRYAYTRFTMPVAILLAVPVGLLVADAIAAPNGQRWFGRATWFVRAAAAVALAHAFLYSVHVDVMLLGDSRYPAERWLKANVPTDAEVLGIGSTTYLPRLEWLGYRDRRLDRDTATVAEVLARKAEVVVTTRRSRFETGGVDASFVEGLKRAGFAVVYEHQASAPLAPLLGTDYIESRVNPEVVIFRRAR